MTAFLSGCSFLLVGAFKGKESKSSLSSKILDYGGFTAAKVSPSLTHLLCSEKEFIKRSPKVQQAIDWNSNEQNTRVWIVEQSWLTESIASVENGGDRLPEEDWDLELTSTQSDEEYDRQDREAWARKQAAKKQKTRSQSEASGSTQTEEGPPDLKAVDEETGLADKAFVFATKTSLYSAHLLHPGDRTVHYRLQILKSNTKNLFWFWSKANKSKLIGPIDLRQAVTTFEHKFRDLTKLRWKDRLLAEPVPGKLVYNQPDIAVEFDDFDLDEEALAQIDAIEEEFAANPSVSLDVTLQDTDVRPALPDLDPDPVDVEPGLESLDEKPGDSKVEGVLHSSRTAKRELDSIEPASSAKRVKVEDASPP